MIYFHKNGLSHNDIDSLVSDRKWMENYKNAEFHIVKVAYIKKKIIKKKKIIFFIVESMRRAR